MNDASTRRTLVCGRFRIDLSQPRVMGIVNLTPDSFSDGGSFERPDDAIARAESQVEEGADLVDLGAESTRPGATPLAIDDEIARLRPVLHALRECGVPVSVDTRRPAVMRFALDAGASMINDVSGFATSEARDAVAASGCGLCVMHMRGDPTTMQDDPRYDDVVAEVNALLGDRVDALLAHGVARERLVIDPGFGFGKTFEHNLALLAGLRTLGESGVPILVGLSRKGLIGRITGRPIAERTAGSVAAALVAVERGASIVRVHDVGATVDALKVWIATR